MAGDAVLQILNRNLTRQEKILLNEFRLGIAPEQECPYLHDRKSRQIITFDEQMTDGLYDELSGYGWRRCGIMYYRNICHGCKACVPARIDTVSFKPDRSQRRNLKQNTDLRVLMAPLKDAREDFELYRKYVEIRHEKVENPTDLKSYHEFLIASKLPGFILHYRDPEGTLLGCAWCDLLPDSISAVYTAFAPDSKRGLGVFSILRQIHLCRMLKKRYLQLGFFIENCRKMNYKLRYDSVELADFKNHWKRH